MGCAADSPWETRSSESVMTTRKQKTSGVKREVKVRRGSYGSAQQQCNAK